MHFHRYRLALACALACALSILVSSSVPARSAQVTSSDLEHATRGTWDQLPPYPFPVSNNAVTSVDRGNGSWTVYSFMGYRELGQGPFQAQVTPLSYRLDLPGGTWTPIRSPPLLGGKARIGANAVTVAGEVYLLGGYTVGGGEVTDHRLYRYDPSSDTYVRLADVPVEVDDTVVGVYEDRYLYLISGWHGPLSRNVRNVQIYDVITDTWTQASPITDVGAGLFGHTGCIVGNKILTIGGARMGFAFPVNFRVLIGTIDPSGAGSIATIDWESRPAHPGRPTYRAAGAQGDRLRYFLAVGGTETTYNLHGNGYNMTPAQPNDQVLLFDFEQDRWFEVACRGPHIPTMDHRALVKIGPRQWATVGGLTAVRVRTAATQRFTLASRVRRR